MTFEPALKDGDIGAIAQYLGKTDPSSVKGAIASLQNRVTSFERKLAGWGRLVGKGNNQIRLH
jgi:predicted transcriptional regulator with HTH domain